MRVADFDAAPGLVDEFGHFRHALLDHSHPRLGARGNQSQPTAERLVRIYSEFPVLPGSGLRCFCISSPSSWIAAVIGTDWESLDVWVTGVNLGGAAEPAPSTEAYITSGLMCL
jgi:hypothetical protein